LGYYNNMINNFNDFINYCLDFYGWNGLYDQGRTREQIAYATLMYLDSLTETRTWGEGDSLDRERVRDIMNELYDWLHKQRVGTIRFYL